MKSWQLVRLIAGVFILASLAMGVQGSPVFVSSWWLAFTAFVGANLLQSALRGLRLDRQNDDIKRTLDLFGRQGGNDLMQMLYRTGNVQAARGTGARMGPGYFPLLLGVLLAILGGITMFYSLVIETPDGDKVGSFAWRPIGYILGANLVFGIMLGGYLTPKFSRRFGRGLSLRASNIGIAIGLTLLTY